MKFEAAKSPYGPDDEIGSLNELAREKIYEFAFFGAPLRLRGSTGSPMRPVAIPFASSAPSATTPGRQVAP
jgi:hypothetical protein